jgi:hypothetical protein
MGLGLWTAWVEEHLPDGHWESEHEWITLCRFHPDGHPSMAVNVDKGVFTCRSCHVGGSISKLAQLPTPPAPASTAEVVNAILAKVGDPQLADASHGDGSPLPESWLWQFDHPHPYWETRLLPETIERFRLGYDPVTDCVTIPMRRPDGALLGVTRRHLDPTKKPRYREPRGVPKDRLLFAAWECSPFPETLVVCEGQVDTMAVWETGYEAVGVGTSQLSLEQALWIRRIAPQRLIVGMDNDTAGRGHPGHRKHGQWRRATGVWSVLEQLTEIPTDVVEWSKKDPAELPVEIRGADLEFRVSSTHWKHHHGHIGS